MKDIYAIQHSRRLHAVTRYFDLSPSVENPTPRSLTQEMEQTLAGYQSTAGGYLALDQQYQPYRTRLGLDNSRESLYGYDDAQGVHYPGTLELGRTATQFQRAGDISDVMRMGPEQREAYLNANPWLRKSLGMLSDAQNQTPILQALNEQAQGALASGGELSPQEVRDLEQQTLAGFVDSGMAHGNQSMGALLLNRDAAKRGRMAAGQKFAGDVEGLNATWRDFLGRSTQIDATVLSDPWQAILGRASGAGGSSSMNGYPQTIGTGNQPFDPLNPYAADLYNTNFNSRSATNIANANSQAATNSALISAGGAIVGGLLSDIRAKEKIETIGDVWIPLRWSGWAKVPWVEFEYRAGCVPQGLRPIRYQGVMADDVEEFRPDAVTVDPRTGFKQVDYAMLGIEMKEAA